MKSAAHSVSKEQNQAVYLYMISDCFSSLYCVNGAQWAESRVTVPEALNVCYKCIFIFVKLRRIDPIKYWLEQSWFLWCSNYNVPFSSDCVQTGRFAFLKQTPEGNSRGGRNETTERAHHRACIFILLATPHQMHSAQNKFSMEFFFKGPENVFSWSASYSEQ